MKILQHYLLTAALVVVSSGIRAGETEQRFDIAAQDLGPALQKLAAQSGVSIFYASDSVAGRKAQALKGQYSTNAALTRLLSGSGLIYSVSADGSISVKPASVLLNKAEPTVLKTVKVSADAVRDVTDPYNDDYALTNATTGTKTDTPIMETPLNVQVVSKQVLKDQQVIQLDQALKNVSGVTTGNDPMVIGTIGTNQEIKLRGFASQTFFRNGFRLTEGAATREMANVENVEVLKGSAATLYGLVEPGGMVNVITKQPLATPYYSAQQQFGSYNLYRTTVDATGPLTKDDTLLYRMNMSYENSGSFRDFVQNEKFFVAPVLKWNISPKTQATLEFEYNHGNLGMDTQFVPVLNGQFIRVPRSRNYQGPGATSKQDTFFGGFNWSHQFTDDWAIKHSFAGNQQATDRLALIPASPAFSPTQDQTAGILYQTDTTNNTYSTNIDLTGHFNTAGLKHTLLLGGDYYRTDTSFGVSVSSMANYPDGLAYFDIYNPVFAGNNGGLTTIDPTTFSGQKQKTDQYGLYLQDQIKLPYNVHFTGGLRYQYLHQQLTNQSYNVDTLDTPLTADAVTPRVGLLWKAQNWLSLYSNYTENFGANKGSIYVDGVNNKPAPPTSAQQWEIGAKTEFFDGRLRATLAYYDLTKQNVATVDPDPAHAGFSLVTGEVRSRGPELDIQGEILPGWNAIATYANTDIIVTKGTTTGDNTAYPAPGSRFYGVPRNTASLWNTYEFQQDSLRGFKIGGGVTIRDGQLAYDPQFSGSRPAGQISIPGYTTVDLLAAYSLKVGKSKVTAQLNINNLLDKYYFSSAYVFGIPSASGFDASYVSYGAPRSVMGSIRVDF